MPGTPAAALRRLAVVLCLAFVVSLLAPPTAFAADPTKADIRVTYVGFPAKAQTAFEYAVRRWESMLTSPIPIKVKVEYTPLPGTYALGHAGPSAVTGPPAPLRNNRFYPIALANALTGTNLKPLYDLKYDITGEFNSALPNWYFGTDGKTPAGRIDFVTVVMHELGHGLGIGGWLKKNGVRGGYYPSGGSPALPGIYDTFTEARSGKRLLSYTNDSIALGNQLTSRALYWGGPRGIAYAGGTRPRMYAPSVFVEGTSYSHLNEATYRRGSRNALMTPSTSTGESNHSPGPIVLGMLRDMGWKLGPAGIDIVQRLTLQSISLSDGKVPAGAAVTVRGVLRGAEGGKAIAGEKVQLYRRPVGSLTWKLVGGATTSALGAVSFVVRPERDTRYQLRHPRSVATDGDVSALRLVDVS